MMNYARDNNYCESADGQIGSSDSNEVSEMGHKKELEQVFSTATAFDLESEDTQKELDRIYRKLDRRIIPPLWILYFLTSFGSSAYGVALTMNMDKGHSLSQTLNLSAHQLSVASALYYVGYIVFDVPINLVMTKVAPHAWLSRIVISVGVVYACYAALNNAGGVIAIRLISGICGAGTWPGLAYYVSLWYPAHRTARRIGYYFTAAQVSAATAGLFSAAFQTIDGNRGLKGFQWFFLVYGVFTVTLGVSLLWWLPGRPSEFNDLYDESHKIDQLAKTSVLKSLLNGTFSKHPLSPLEQQLHAADMSQRYLNVAWTLKDLLRVFMDIRIWPLVIMYFGVVGTGYGIVVAGTSIIKSTNESLTPIQLSLLFCPIWVCDLLAILAITPLSDRYKNRPLFFCASTVVIIVGMVVNTYAPGSWPRYVGLLITGLGLGPTVPICMTWAAEIFMPKYQDVGVAATSALVSGLGNLGSVVTTYALYKGWSDDVDRGFKYSNMTVVGILGASIIAALLLGYTERRRLRGQQ
ncbi:Vitamin H transporter 1 [Yarrowia lipolytica]|nr:Vitamin H transporter 1 [Yarrowia lipolytica]